MAEQPNFNTLSASVTAASNGLAVAATEMQKLQNIPVVNLAAQMTRMEERIIRELRKMYGSVIRSALGGFVVEN